MNKFVKLILMSIIIIALTNCTSLPDQIIRKETVIGKTNVTTLTSNFNVSYTIEFNVNKNEKNDSVLITLETAINNYKLYFPANKDIKKIFAEFLRLAEIASQKNKDGFENIGDTNLLCYAYCENEEELTRVDVIGNVHDKINFIFLTKNKIPYLVLNGFYTKTLFGKEKIDSYIESIPISYEDVKSVYEFMCDIENIKRLRVEDVQEPDSDTSPSTFNR